MESSYKEHDEFGSDENPENKDDLGSDLSGSDSVDSDGEVFYNKKFIRKCK